MLNLVRRKRLPQDEDTVCPAILQTTALYCLLLYSLYGVYSCGKVHHQLSTRIKQEKKSHLLCCLCLNTCRRIPLLTELNVTVYRITYSYKTFSNNAVCDMDYKVNYYILYLCNTHCQRTRMLTIWHWQTCVIQTFKATLIPCENIQKKLFLNHPVI